MFGDAISAEDMRQFLHDTGSPSDANVIFDEPYNNISRNKMAEGDAFEIPESLWPRVQGRNIVYKDFSELSVREQLEALGVSSNFIRTVYVVNFRRHIETAPQCIVVNRASNDVYKRFFLIARLDIAIGHDYVQLMCSLAIYYPSYYLYQRFCFQNSSMVLFMIVSAQFFHEEEKHGQIRSTTFC